MIDTDIQLEVLSAERTAIRYADTDFIFDNASERLLYTCEFTGEQWDAERMLKPRLVEALKAIGRAAWAVPQWREYRSEKIKSLHMEPA